MDPSVDGRMRELYALVDGEVDEIDSLFVKCSLAVVRCLMNLFRWPDDPITKIGSSGHWNKCSWHRTTANWHL